MLLYIILIGIIFIVLERLIPARKLPHVKGWWTRVIIINAFQLAILIVGFFTWDKWFENSSIWHFAEHLNPAIGGLLSYFIITFVFYWWHRWRHEINFLWLGFHQIHHSPQRIETITSFYKHPLEIILNSLIIGSINYLVLGLGVEAASFTLLYSSIGEYFYHMNIATPFWVGYFFQRPEMHRIHHQKSKHYSNFSDLPLWDMIFGTYQNPKKGEEVECGFQPDRESSLGKMLAFQNVNNKYYNTNDNRGEV